MVSYVKKSKLYKLVSEFEVIGHISLYVAEGVQ